MTDSSGGGFACVQCGSAVPRNAQFCLVCGTPVSSRSQSSALGRSAGQAPATGSDGRPLDGWRPAPALTPIRFGDVIPTTYGRRLVAFLLDGVIGTAFWLLVTMPLIGLGVIQVDVTDSTVGVSGLSAVLLIVPALVYPIVSIVLQGLAGFSLGKLALGLRIVRFATLERPGLGAMLLRWLVVAAASLVFGIGQYVVWLSPLWDAQKIGRGWHDRIAGTWVIDVKAGPNPLKAQPGQIVLDEPVRADAPDPRERHGAVSGAPAVPAGAPAVPAPAPTAPIASVPGFAPPATPSPTVAPAPGPGLDEESTRLSAPGAAARPAGVISFRLDSGAVVPIVRHGALGRDPVAPGGDPSDLLIALDGDTLSVSKTHLEFGVEPGGVWVSDRGSTNGTALVRGDGAELVLDPGERMRVQPGDRVRVGTRLFQVEGGA
ncbi:MAG: RDD family protein [Herbiconiux sp.]|nr:RDD family protein [Herbiconiux sp.]